jgi:hypothetical protein
MQRSAVEHGSDIMGFEVSLLLDEARPPGPNARVGPERHCLAVADRQSSGWLMRRNSSTPSCTDFTASDLVRTTMPSVTGVAHEICIPRMPSTSTRHMRHIPTGFIRSCQQNRGM